MLARLLDRLTYANVVATLALFVALGGSAYAVGEISSRDVKNRSLKGGDLRLNTVTGKEINESKLGTVPAARQADNAGLADISRQANSATTAGTADVANVARDAQSLAGQGVGVFERSSRTQFGRASANPAGTPNEQTLFAWPELGVEVRTSVDQCGGGGGTSFSIRSTKSAGNIEFSNGGGSAPSVPPGGTERECSAAGQISVDAEVSDATRSLFLDCINAAGELRCVGIRSEP
jgi:hypothetical protein